MGKRYIAFFLLISWVLLLTVSITADYGITARINAEDDSEEISVNEQTEDDSEQTSVNEQTKDDSEKISANEPTEDAQTVFNEADTVNLCYDIVIYGGGLQAVAAAAKAAGTGPELSVALIVPYPNKELGGIATTGGQNYWDIRKYNEMLYQGGSFAFWHRTFDTGYNVQEFSDFLIKTIEAYDNITTYYCRDIRKVVLTEESNIKSTQIAGIYRDEDGYIRWANNEEEDIIVTGDIFIDASEDSRLLRLSDNELTAEGSIFSVGRYDWPEEHLGKNEISEGVGLQMSATLMFKVKGVICGSYSDMSFGNGDNLAWGGNRTYETSKIIKKFNDLYGPSGFSIKSINASRDGEGSDEWWVNCFVIYNIDARAAQRDLGTENFPDNMLTGSINTDEAWIRGRQFLYEHSKEFLKALHEFDGFGKAKFVYGSDGYPIVGDMLYIRESLHMIRNTNLLGTGTENINYAVTASDSLFAGPDVKSGSDLKNYASRIGIGFYYTDVHPYIYHNEYFSSLNKRLDIIGQNNYKLNPVYIPYEALVTQEIPNLLVAGYGSSISSIAWSELRVFPSIIVMGDAAGVAAAYCGKNDLKPGFLEINQINDIQSILVGIGAILDK